MHAHAFAHSTHTHTQIHCTHYTNMQTITIPNPHFFDRTTTTQCPSSSTGQHNPMSVFLDRTTRPNVRFPRQDKHNPMPVFFDRSTKQTQPNSHFPRQNMRRASRRMKKSLGRGCRYIGHGLANMTSMIPEASYMGPITPYRDFDDDYITSDYI